MDRKIFAVDIGGSKLICAVLNLDGEILETYRLDFPKGYTVETIIDYIKESYQKLKHHNCFYSSVTIPGLCDSEKGLWLYSPFTQFGNIKMAEIVTEITGLPTACDNDVNMSALAEKYFGLCKQTNDFLWITVSNGIGGGLFLNGKLYRGANLSAGEIGHFIVDENTHRKCGCGSFGCLEAMASGASVCSIYKELTGESLSGLEIEKLAREGNQTALKVWSDAGFYIGKAVSYAVNLLGFDTVILGGGAAEAFDLLKPSIDSAIEKFVFSSANPDVKVLHSALGKYAALKGCAALVRYHLENL